LESLTDEMPVSDEPFDRARAEWLFRRHGLPSLVHEVTGVAVLNRTMPVQVLLFTVANWLWIVAAVGGGLLVQGSVLAAGLLLVPVVRAGVRGSRAVVRYATYALVFSWPVTLSVATAVILSPGGTWRGDVFFALQMLSVATLVLLAVTGLSCLAVGLGVVRLVGLAARDVVDAGRVEGGGRVVAVPVLFVLTLFFFLNPDVWQVGYGIGWGRLSAGLLVFLLVAYVTCVGRARDVAATVSDSSGEEREMIPWPARTVTGRPVTADMRRVPQQTGFQRANLALAITGRLLAQAVWVGAAMFVFLFVLGTILVPRSTGEAWIDDNDTDRYWNGPVVGDGPVVVSVTMVKVALLLAGFSVLYFVVVTAGEQRYQRLFFDPLAHQLRRLLQIHAAYSVYLEQPGRAPAGLSQMTFTVSVSIGTPLVMPGLMSALADLIFEAIRSFRGRDEPEEQRLEEQREEALPSGVPQWLFRVLSGAAGHLWFRKPLAVFRFTVDGKSISDRLARRWDPDRDPFFTARNQHPEGVAAALHPVEGGARSGEPDRPH
jgi:hypothetical protein